jgi:hypothetical protein
VLAAIGILGRRINKNIGPSLKDRLMFDITTRD